MLAVSPACSQVSPDYLQAPPVLVFRAVATQQLGKPLAARRLESQPREITQHNATSGQCCSLATTRGVKYPHSPIVLDANALAALLCPDDDAKFMRTQYQPQEGPDGTPRERDGQCQNHDEPADGSAQPCNDDETS